MKKPLVIKHLNVLHLHSAFHPGGKELRAAKLINLFGPGITHSIVSAQPGAMGAASAINPDRDVVYPEDFPPLNGRPMPGRLQRIARAMFGYDLVLTYNWGAMDAVMAHMLFGDHVGAPPLIHHEDGFNEDEADRLKSSRNWFRRIALARASALVVPSAKLEGIARDVWHQPEGRIVRIANGIDTAAFAHKRQPNALPRIIKRKGEFWVGTLAGLRAVKNLPRLVRCFHGLPENWQLVILGTGPEHGAIIAEAERLGVADRVHLPGFVADPAKAIGLFDIFALSSDSEQFPISVVEAMAAGLPVASPAVGDVAGMVSEANRRFVPAAGDEDGLSAALAELAASPDLRTAIGKANRAMAVADYDEASMLARYREVYGRAIGRGSFP